MNELQDIKKVWDINIKNNNPGSRVHSHFKSFWGENKWIKYGNMVYKNIKYFLDKHNLNHLESVIEYGSGGGAIARVLCEEFKEYTAIDICQESLDELALQMYNFDLNNFETKYFNGNLDNLKSRKKYDFAVSFAVFQHLPSYDYSQKVLHKFNYLLKKDGYGLIQFRYPKGEKYKSKTDNYEKNYISMLSFTDDQIKEQLNIAGFKVIELIEFPNKSAYKYILFKKA